MRAVATQGRKSERSGWAVEGVQQQHPPSRCCPAQSVLGERELRKPAADSALPGGRRLRADCEGLQKDFVTLTG